MKKIIFILFAIIPFIGFSQTDSTKVAVKEETVFMVVETMPEFPGGEKEMYKFIIKQLEYPRIAREEGIEGKVFVQFVVNKEGKVTKAKVLRGIGYGCDREALRVVKKMPRWKPGTQQGKRVSVVFTLPFDFKLK